MKDERVAVSCGQIPSPRRYTSSNVTNVTYFSANNDRLDDPRLPPRLIVRVSAFASHVARRFVLIEAYDVSPKKLRAVERVDLPSTEEVKVQGGCL